MKSIYWRKHTEKALLNFPIKDYLFPEEFIKNLALIKGAAARANGDLGLLEKRKARAIYEVALKISKGDYKEQFPLSIYQTGSGTSTNMNMNEVISSIVREKYKLELHPNDDVNKCQSSNDVIPTTIYITTLKETKEKLLPSIKNLENYFGKKGREFYKIITLGRTHLQEATPISLGDEFYGYAKVVEIHRKNIEISLKNLYFLPLGGTAVGTGINSHKDFAPLAIKYLKKFTKLPLKEGKNHFALQSSIGNLAIFSSSLKNLSLDLLKILRDLKLKNLFEEISIPPLQAGSSIMPGKVNPVSLEVLEQILINVIGNDLKISISSLSGNFELNTYLPLVAFNLMENIELLSIGINLFVERTLKNLKANPEICKRYAENSPALATPLSLKIGYDRAAELVKEAKEKNVSIKELVFEKNILSKEELDEIFNLKKLAFPFNSKKNRKR